LSFTVGGCKLTDSMSIQRESETQPNVSAQHGEEEYLLSPLDLLRVVWKRLWVVLLVAVLLSGVVVGISLTQTPTYVASIKIFVGQKGGLSETSNAYNLQLLTLTMVELLNSRPVAEAAVEQQDLQTSPDELLDNLSVAALPDTQVIQVDYSDSDQQRARRTVNAVGEAFSYQIAKRSPDSNGITATVWVKATTPDAPVSPNPIRNGLLAAVAGVVLGLGLAFLLEYLDDSWDSAEEAELVSRVPTFGVIPQFEVPKSVMKGKF